MKPAILATNPIYYYQNLAAAVDFYTRVLGLPLTGDWGDAVRVQTSPTSFLTLMDAARSDHPTAVAQSVTTAFVSQQVEDWYSYLTGQGVAMRYDLTPDSGKAHEGFVALDPEGYYLEFERFNPHPENDRLLPRLAQVTPLLTRTASALPISATVLWLYYEEIEAAQAFWEGMIGTPLVVDQGYAQIYCPSPSGFIGPVVAGKGMHTFAPVKRVSVALITDDGEGWQAALSQVPGFLPEPALPLESGLEAHLRGFYGLDPGRYRIGFAQPR
jgi:catechol 2,3-dioxygenase-like lactoylglutathione lyase family enzyme